MLGANTKSMKRSTDGSNRALSPENTATDAWECKVDEFAFFSNLCILNDGDELTFYAVKPGIVLKSIIDYSMATYNLLPHVTGWEVTDEITSYGHRSILISLQLLPTDTVSSCTKRFGTPNANFEKFHNKNGLFEDKWTRVASSIQTKTDIDCSVLNIFF